jgi:hypothetical protein
MPLPTIPHLLTRVHHSIARVRRWRMVDVIDQTFHSLHSHSIRRSG